MSRFLVLFQVPPDVIDRWKATDAETRKPAEDKMRADWDAWMQRHASVVSGTEAGGRTKRVTADGVADVRNAIMLHCFVEASSHDEAARIFADHPHLTIPQSSIEIMESRTMGG
jgi:hypothetical protein